MTSGTVLIECLDGRGRVQLRERFQLTAERLSLTIGRSIAADMPIDDDHAAALHAELKFEPDGRVLVSDLGSINGIVVGGKRHHAASGLDIGGKTLQVGRTLLRVRTSQETLGPEKPDHIVSQGLLRRPGVLAAAGAVVVSAQQAYVSWLQAPQDLTIAIAQGLSMIAAIYAAWVAVWALLSRVMRGEWRWFQHVAIVLGVWAAYQVIDSAVDLGMFAFSLQRWSNPLGIIIAIAFGTCLYLHLVNASHITTRRALTIAVLIPALLGGGGYWLMERAQATNVNRIEAYLKIYPASLRVAPAMAKDAYFASVAGLREAADNKRKSIPANDSGEEDSDD